MTEERFRRAFVILLVVAISAAFVAMIRMFLLTILLAAIFAAVSRPLYLQVERGFRGRSGVASAFTILVLLVLVITPLSLLGGTQLDWGKFAAGMLGLFLMIASFLAAGLYISAQVRTPLIAAVASFGLLMLLVVLYMSGSAEGTASELFIYLSHFGHFLSFLQGLFDSSDLVYYFLFSAAFLILTIRRLDNERLAR